MRRTEHEVTDRAGIDAMIRASRVLRLGLVDGGEPYVVPLCFGYDGTSFWFHCAPRGRKLDIIAVNDRVCFELDELETVIQAPRACGWAARYRCVMGTGRAAVVRGEDEKRHGLSIIMAQYSADEHVFGQAEVDRVAVVRVDIGSLTGKKSDRPD